MNDAYEHLRIRLGQFQDEVTDWQGEIFPTATLRSRLNHLSSELRELQNTIDNLEEGRALDYDEAFFSRRRSDIGFELADMFLLMLAIAGGEEIRLGYYITKKFEINQERNWGKPNEQGFVEHIRDGEQK